MNKHNAKIESLLETHDRISKSKILAEMKMENSKLWLNQRKMNLTKRTQARNRFIAGARGNDTDDFAIGNMFLFQYEAKTKSKLEYYDEFPLILPFGTKGKNILGLNLHYIPPRIRAYVLTLLRFNKNGRALVPLKSIIEEISTNKAFAPAIHSYIPANIKSISKIHPEDWESVIFLPIAQFVSYKHNSNPSIQKVYSDYYKKV